MAQFFRGFFHTLLVLAAAFALFLGVGYWNARADPLVRRLSVVLPGWPAKAPPVTIALVSDIHLESATMDARRLNRIVDQINASKPDLIILAGDFIQGYDASEPAKVAPILAPALRRLSAPLGTIAVLGNHDWWTDGPEVRRIVEGAGIPVLQNAAITRGPLAIGGVDDDSTHHERVLATAAAVERLPGARIMVAHSPEAAHILLQRNPRPVALLLAGHTHCGQVVLPFIGPPVEVVEARYRCGVIRDPGLTTVVTAGVGTSEVPLRYGAPPDIWLVTVGPSRPHP